MFISTSTVLCIYVFTFTLRSLVEEPGTLWNAMSVDAVSVSLVVYCFISVWFVGGLSVLHFYLMCTNQTTYENFRYRYDKKENPHNRGIIKNLKEILFSKTPHLVNFREWVNNEAEQIQESVSKRFGGDVKNSNMKIDLELGIIAKDDKPSPDHMQKLEDSLKKDNGGKIVDDPFSLSTGPDKNDDTRHSRG